MAAAAASMDTLRYRPCANRTCDTLNFGSSLSPSRFFSFLSLFTLAAFSARSFSSFSRLSYCFVLALANWSRPSAAPNFLGLPRPCTLPCARFPGCSMALRCMVDWCMPTAARAHACRRLSARPSALRRPAPGAPHGRAVHPPVWLLDFVICCSSQSGKATDTYNSCCGRQGCTLRA